MKSQNTIRNLIQKYLGEYFLCRILGHKYYLDLETEKMTCNRCNKARREIK